MIVDQSKNRFRENFFKKVLLLEFKKFQNSIANYGNFLENCYIDCPQQNVDCEIKGGVIRKADLGRNAMVSPETEKVKDFNEVRMDRFITDSRLKDSNDPIVKIRFKNINY